MITTVAAVAVAMLMQGAEPVSEGVARDSFAA